jgi:cytochrome c biogenesis protein CcmG, thiol:disulfide interchange protein DsbE
MRKPVTFAILTAIVVTAAALGTPTAAHATAPPVGKAAPDFKLKSIAGNDLDLQSLKGRVVVVNFFATWCPPCRAETPDLVAIEAKYRPRGVVFLGVDDRESGDLVRVFTAVKHIAFPVVLDADGSVEEHYDVRAIPTTYVLDRNGVIRYRNVSQLDGKLLSGVIGAVLTGRPPQLTPIERRFDGIAVAATATIKRDTARRRLDAAIAAGTKAANALTDIQNGDQQTELDYTQSTRLADALYSALADAYELRARSESAPARIRSDLEQAALQRGQVSEDREQFAAAERSYAQAIGLEPADTAAYDGEYLAAYEQRNYREALEVASAETHVAPNDPESWLTLASANNETKNFAAALRAEQRARTLAIAYLAKHPAKKHAKYEVGRVWLKMARTEIMAGRPTVAIGMLRTSAIAAPETIVQQQADEQRIALEPAQTNIAIAGAADIIAPAMSPGELYIAVINKAADRRTVQLVADNVPPKWVLSFCYAKVCDPFKSTISLDPGKSLKVQLKLVPLQPTGGPWRMRLEKTDDQKIVVGVAAKTTHAKIAVTGS